MTGRIGRNDATRRLAFLAFAAVAWLGLGSATGSAQTAPGYCPVQADVAPGSCVCPSNTTWQATQASCAAGRCGCAMGLQWNGSYCAQPPPPPPPPPPMCQGGCRPNQVCVNGACVGTGDLRFTLTWDQPGDVDLYVVTPGGRTISYRARQADSGTLDRDDRTGTGPENVFWADDPPAGTYLVCVNPYRIQRPTNFTVQVVRSGLPTQTMQGSLPSSRQPSGCQQGGRDFLGAIEVQAPVATPPPPQWPQQPQPGGTQWVPASNGAVPANAVVAGREADGRPTYVCRSSYSGGVHVGRLVSPVCSFGFAGSEIQSPTYEVLVGAPGRWVPSANGQIPQGAVIGGREANGAGQAVCRATYGAGLFVGKVAGANCSFGYGGREVLIPQYEVLLPY